MAKLGQLAKLLLKYIYRLSQPLSIFCYLAKVIFWKEGKLAIPGCIG